MIELTDLSVGYGGLPVLSGVNDAFPAGEFTCIVGRNGCGKSTLIRAMAGILPYSGAIRLLGREVGGMGRGERAKLLAYLPQDRPIPAIDVYTLISHGRYAHMGFAKVLSAYDREWIEHAACMTGVQDLLDRETPSLSGGERQRVYIAMAIAQNAKVILLDEPATYLDIRHQLQVMELLRDLNRSGTGVVMAAHDLAQAFHYATGLRLIDRGGIIASGPPGLLCESDALRSAMGVSVERSSQPGSVYDYHLTKVRS